MSASNEENKVQDELSEALLPRGDGEVEEVASESVGQPLEPHQTSVVEDLDSPEGGNRVLPPLLVDNETETESNPIFGILSKTVKWFLPEASGDVNEDEHITRDASRSLVERDEVPPASNLLEGLLQQWDSLLDCFMCTPTNPFVKSAITLALSVAVLQASYFWWGFLQELIMTTEFTPTEHVPDGRFPSAAFCVWVNRLAAVIASSVVVFCRQGLSGSFNKSPLRAFSPISLSNTLSSFSQYSSLRFVSFPVMMISKSLKIVSVMIVGKMLHGTRYAWGEYVEAVVIAIGVFIFSIESRNYSHYGAGGSPIIGYLLILSFVFCDAFTVQWQGKIYDTYGRRNVDPFQMMLGVNVFSIALTSLSLLISGDIGVVIQFLNHNPVAIKYLAKAAVASCVGQLCIFFLIREYGPVVFTIVMTTRQMLAMVLSTILFGHAMSLIAVFGAVLVFATVAFQIRRNYRLSRDPEVLQE